MTTSEKAWEPPFSPPPNDHAPEWPGLPIGQGNIITRSKGRTSRHDKTLDKDPPKRERLIAQAQAYVRGDHPKHKVHQHDVVIHGVRVRAYTNEKHLYDFWVGNWFSVEEWAQITGQPAPEEPQVAVYALGEIEGEETAAYYSREKNTIVFFNTSYYGQLKSWVLGAVGRVLAEEYGIQSIHGAVAALDGKGALYIAPTGTGKSTASYGMMDSPNSRFHSDDWVYVRYTLATRDGGRIAPVEVVGSAGSPLRGSDVFGWLQAHTLEAGASVTGLTLSGQMTTIPSSEIDLAQPIEAYAYTSEKYFYLRSNLVESFPLAAYQLLRSQFENCPDPSPRFMGENRGVIEGLVEQLLQSPDPNARAFFSAQPREELATTLARMFMFDNTRAMLDIAAVFGAERVFMNPLEPVKLSSVFLIKREFSDPVVLTSLSEADFLARLLIGLTPDGKREIAYNSYRAVDDNEEAALVATLEKSLEKGLNGSDYASRLMKAFYTSPSVPPTLYREMALFSLLYQATSCYGINTTLASDPNIKFKQAAVLATNKLLARTVEEQPRTLALKLDNYRSYLN